MLMGKRWLDETVAMDRTLTDDLDRMCPVAMSVTKKVSTFCFLGSISAADLQQVFPTKMWAYRCATCSRCLLKPTAGMAQWREGAKRQTVGTLAWKVASLPVVQCNRGVCDPCVSQNKRLAESSARSPNAALSCPPAAPVNSLPAPAAVDTQISPSFLAAPRCPPQLALATRAAGAVGFNLVGGGAASGDGHTHRHELQSGRARGVWAVVPGIFKRGSHHVLGKGALRSSHVVFGANNQSTSVAIPL